VCLQLTASHRPSVWEVPATSQPGHRISRGDRATTHDHDGLARDQPLTPVAGFGPDRKRTGELRQACSLAPSLACLRCGPCPQKTHPKALAHAIVEMTPSAVSVTPPYGSS